MPNDDYAPNKDESKQLNSSSTESVFLLFLSKAVMVAVFAATIFWNVRNPEKRLGLRSADALFYWLPLAIIVALSIVTKIINKKYYKEVELKGLKGMKTLVYIGHNRFIPFLNTVIGVLVAILVGILFSNLFFMRGGLP